MPVPLCPAAATLARLPGVSTLAGGVVPATSGPQAKGIHCPVLAEGGAGSSCAPFLGAPAWPWVSDTKLEVSLSRFRPVNIF